MHNILRSANWLKVALKGDYAKAYALVFYKLVLNLVLIGLVTSTGTQHKIVHSDT